MTRTADCPKCGKHRLIGGTHAGRTLIGCDGLKHYDPKTSGQEHDGYAPKGLHTPPKRSDLTRRAVWAYSTSQACCAAHSQYLTMRDRSGMHREGRHL